MISNFPIEVLSGLSLHSGKDPEGSSGNPNSAFKQYGWPRASKTPKAKTDLTFLAYLHGPTYFCPTVFLEKPGSIFDTLQTVLEMLVCCLPGVDLH